MSTKMDFNCRRPWGLLMLLLSFAFLFSSASAFAPDSPNDSSGQFSVWFREAEEKLHHKEYGAAQDILKRLLEAAPLYQDEESGKSAWFLLGLSYDRQGESKKALNIFLQGLDSLRKAPYPDLYLKYHLARIFGENDISDAESKVTGIFYEVLTRLSPVRQRDLWSFVYDQTRIFLTPAEQEQVLEMVDAGSGDPGSLLLRAFKRLDPSPADPTNEFIYRFFQRTKYAREKFGDNLNPRGYDDRGDIFVKLGPPSRMFYRRTGVRGAVGFALYPYELWFYKHIHPDIYFTFIGKVGKSYYTLVDGPESIFGTFYRGHRVFFNRFQESQTAMFLRTDLYMSFAPLHKTFRERLRRMEEQASVSEALEYALQNFPDEDREHMKWMNEYLKQVFLGSDFTKEQMAFEYDWSVFKGADTNNRVEFYFLIPYEELIFTFTPRYQTDVRTEIGIFDSQFNLVYGDSLHMIVPHPSQSEIEGGGLTSQFAAELPPGQYTVTFRVDNYSESEPRQRIIQTHIQVDTLQSDTLQLSEIELAQDVHPTLEPGRFSKRGLYVLPLPMHSHDKTLPLFVYFEIYNLTLDANGEGRYEVTCQLVRNKGNKTIFAKIGSIFKSKSKQKIDFKTRLQKSVPSSDVGDFLKLDLQKLREDKYILALTVTDLQSSQSTRRSIPIELYGD